MDFSIHTARAVEALHNITVTWTPLVGVPVAGVVGLLTNPPDAVLLGGLGVSATQPRLRVNADDIPPTAANGDTVTDGTRTWRVQEFHHHEAAGIVRCLLQSIP